MNNKSGILFLIDEPKRGEDLLERIENSKEFTDVLSVPDWRPKETEIFLISFDNQHLQYAAFVKRGRGAATAKYQIIFSNFVNLAKISFREIEQNVGARLKSHFIRSSSGIGGRVPPKTWADVVRAIKQLRPDLAPDLDHLENMRNASTKIYRGKGFEIVAQEKDAIGISLDIFYDDRKRIFRSISPTIYDKPAPFIKSLIARQPSEDQIIIHETNHFPGWERLQDYDRGAVEFIREGEKLTIVNANRTSLEHSLGVDLIYFHHKYNSYVLVQFKKMEEESKIIGFRPIGKSYKKELKRMNDFNKSLTISGPAKHPNDYRLNSKPFYFKLCSNVDFEPISTELLPGMYFPLAYWKLLNASEDVIGPKGGVRITFGNSGRHITNTDFKTLVQDGWIGSRGDVSNSILEAIELALAGVENDRSVIMAVSERIQA